LRVPDPFRRLRSALLGLCAALCLGAPARAAVPVDGFKIVHIYPHDTGAFTEGLFYLRGDLYESTGIPGQSTIRRVRLSDGQVLQQQVLPPSMFGEGIVDWGSEIISLTWQDKTGFRWDLKTFARKSIFHYPGEGWALTQDGKHLIMSDGTPALRILDPVTFKELRRVPVTADGRPVANLNELEWVKGEVLANIWQTNRIARIDPISGKVKAWIDLTGLPETGGAGNPDAVLNGIAYDREHDRLFVTGKYWSHLYEIRLAPPKAPAH
jgi:glutaminyl-peptide cyclotransferase